MSHAEPLNVQLSLRKLTECALMLRRYAGLPDFGAQEKAERW
jgi:hypothetical protein